MFGTVGANEEQSHVVFRKVVVVVLLGLLPAALLVDFLLVATAAAAPSGRAHAVDFHTFWQGARVYLQHRNPYPTLSTVSSWNPQVQQSFVYPAPVLVVLAPFALVSYSVAVSIFVPLLAAAVAGALWLFGVRDWRCYGAAFASPAVLTGISGGTISPFLLVGLAVLWRWRNRTFIAAAAAAALLVAKLFLWPVVLWLWFTGRRRAALTSVGAGIVAAVAAWTWNGFGGLGGYPEVLRRVGVIEGPHSYAPLWWLGHSSLFVVAAVLGSAGLAVACRRRDDAFSFSIAVTVSLLLTPILWLHYFALMPAVVAVHNRRLSVGWLLPVALWLTPQQGSYGAPWRTVLVAAVLLMTALASGWVTSRRQADVGVVTSQGVS